MKRLDGNNRTEKFWTATVLTSLIADDQFAGVKVFLDLLKSSSGQVLFRRPNMQDVVEIGEFGENAWTYENFQISTELWYSRDFSKTGEFAVPDVILLLNNKHLIVCEAKYFQRVKVEKIEEQVFLQKKTITDIIKNYTDIEYVHHAFIYGGSEGFDSIKGIDSIITWEDIYKAFLAQKGKEQYFVKVLAEGLKNYKREFPKQNRKGNYYMRTFDFIDVIGECRANSHKIFVGIGTAGTAEATLEGLIAGAKEELNVLRDLHKNEPQRFKHRPEFLKDVKYKYRSALEYLFKHSNQPYKVDYTDDGSGDDKSNNPKWIDGYSLLNMLKKLIK